MSVDVQEEIFNDDEFKIHKRIRAVQNQIRIAIQNHHVLYSRLLAFPKDTDLENHMRILQELIISMGRSQLELVDQFKQEIRAKHGKDNVNQIMSSYLSWGDRHLVVSSKQPKVQNGTATEAEKGSQPTKKKLMPPPRLTGKSGNGPQKTSNGSNTNTPPLRKESERIKAAAASKLADSNSNKTNSTNASKLQKSIKNVQSNVKGKNEKRTLLKQNRVLQRRNSNCDEKSSTLARKTSPAKPDSPLKREEIIEIKLENLSQESFLEFFGLINKDKSKMLIVNQSKRKRRTVAGQSSHYNDYLQPKRPYRKLSAPSSATVSPASSQDIETEEEKPVQTPPSNEKPVDTEDVTSLEEQETKEKSPAKVEPAESLSNHCDNNEEKPNEEIFTVDLVDSPDEDSKDDDTPKINGIDSDKELVLIAPKREIKDNTEDTFPTETTNKSPQETITSTISISDEEKGSLSPSQTANSPLSEITSHGADENCTIENTPPKNDDICIICDEGGQMDLVKCSMCDEGYHRECSPNTGAACPSCNTMPTSISSIVGVNSDSSTLTSTNCSEMVKRYLDDHQDDKSAEVKTNKDATS